MMNKINRVHVYIKKQNKTKLKSLTTVMNTHKEFTIEDLSILQDLNIDFDMLDTNL